MKYFVDNKELTFEDYRNRVYGQIYAMVQADSLSYFNGTRSGDSELGGLFLKLEPIEKELAIIMVSKRMLEEYLDLNSFEIRDFKFRRE